MKDITLKGDCVTCGHDGTRHKGIDPEKRIQSRCTALQKGTALRCMCDNYQVQEK